MPKPGFDLASRRYVQTNYTAELRTGQMPEGQPWSMVSAVSTSPPENERFDPDDLALNRPGATLREKSIEIKRNHPVLVFILRFLGAHSDERAWRRGAEGEKEVAFQLRKLGEGWRVLHSVPVGAGDTDIDHVVIGPSGVFTLNTKNHLGGRVSVNAKAVYVNGKYQPYIVKSRVEGKRARKLLSAAFGYDVAVRPVVVIMAKDLRIKSSPEDVNVVGRKRISKWLAGQLPTLTQDSVDAIYAVARRRSTWVG